MKCHPTRCSATTLGSKPQVLLHGCAFYTGPSCVPRSHQQPWPSPSRPIPHLNPVSTAWSDDPQKRLPLSLHKCHLLRAFSCLPLFFFFQFFLILGHIWHSPRLYAQESLLVLLGEPYEMPKIKRGSAVCKANTRPVVLLLRPHPFLSETIPHTHPPYQFTHVILTLFFVTFTTTCCLCSTNSHSLHSKFAIIF